MRHRWFMRNVLIVSFLLLAGLAYVAAPAADQPEPWKAPARAAKRKNPVPANAESIAAGNRIYVKECLSCHGDKGKGDGPAAISLERPPGDLSSAKVQAQTDGELFWKITEGRKPMPSFAERLSDTQRWQVVNYVRTLGPQAQPPK